MKNPCKPVMISWCKNTKVTHMGGYSAYNNVSIIYTDVEYIGKDICKRNQAEICRSDGVTNRRHIWKHGHNPHLDDGCVNFWKDFLKVLSKISFLDFDKFSKIISEFERFLCEIFSNLAKKFQNLESISCVQIGAILAWFSTQKHRKIHLGWFHNVFRKNMWTNCVSLILMLFLMFSSGSLAIAHSDSVWTLFCSKHPRHFPRRHCPYPWNLMRGTPLTSNNTFLVPVHPLVDMKIVH